MKPPEVTFDVGESFLMKVPMPESMYDSHGESFVVEAKYEGTLPDTDVETAKADGSLKEIYNCLNFSEHHIVSFDNTMWINDFINPGEGFSPTPIV
jgi:hypothetical protein